MFITIASSVTSWLSQLQALLGNKMTRLQPEQYAIGLVVCIVLGYMLLRGRD